MLNKNLVEKDGIYIALRTMDQYCETNTYMPPWEVLDGEYFNDTRSLNWQGWLRIDTVPLAEFSTDAIPVRYHKNPDGEDSVNVVLVAYKAFQDWNVHCNPYGISNSVWASAHSNEYNGWMELEDIPIIVLPKEQRHVHTTKEEDKILNLIFEDIDKE
jgi:hypothetical protein